MRIKELKEMIHFPNMSVSRVVICRQPNEDDLLYGSINSFIEDSEIDNMELGKTRSICIIKLQDKIDLMLFEKEK